MKKFNYKQWLLSGPVGVVLLGVRDRLELLSAALTGSEDLGTLLNDQLATRLTVKMCRPGKTFLDIGAHIGSVVSSVLQHDRSIKVIAIEAVPHKAEALRRMFPSVECHACAVGEKEGRVSFFIDEARPGFSSLIRSAGSVNDKKIEMQVPMARVDTLVVSSDVDVVKIDVEGAELDVLRGARGLLRRCRPVVMFESGPVSGMETEAVKAALWQELTDLDYLVFVPNRLAHDGVALSKEGFMDGHTYPRRTTNYFAVPAERRIEIRDRARKILRK